jgi:hypothetical protein
MDALIAFLVAPFQFVIDAINHGFQFVLDFFYQDIYPMITKAYAEFIKAYLISEIEFKIFMLKFAWDVAKELLTSLNISPLIASAWSQLDSRVLQFITFFRIPEGINLLISAYTTRFVYRFTSF